MEYQKIVDLLDNTLNEPSKFRKKNLVEINDDTRGMYKINSQIKFKAPMLNSCLCDYSDAYILNKGIISIAQVPPPPVNPNNNKKEVVFKNCAPFTEFISKINNTQIDNPKEFKVAIPMYNLIKYNYDYLKALGSL